MVAVATSLPITVPDVPLRVLDPADADAATALAEKWNLGGSMTRALTAVSNAALAAN